MRSIINATLLAITACAGVNPHDMTEDWSPPEKTFEEAGFPGQEYHSNAMQAPILSPEDVVRWQYANAGAGIPAGIPASSDQVVRYEALQFDRDTQRTSYRSAYIKRGRMLRASEIYALQLPLDDSFEFDLDDVPLPQESLPAEKELKDYWATGMSAAAGAPPSPPAKPPGTAATCDNIPDICQIGFEPWCNGGVGKVSPGGIAESSSGCRGSTIKHGGPGQERPDNADLRITFWNGTFGSCNDTQFNGTVALKWTVDWLNNHDQVLPPPYQITPVGCSASGTNMPPGYTLCTDGASGLVWACPGDAATWGTLTDVLFQYLPLDTDSPGVSNYCGPLNTGPGFNRANAVTLGCTASILEKDAGGTPVVRQWNNGFTNTFYWTRRGSLVTIDPANVTDMVNDPASLLDRGGLNATTRNSYLHINIQAHEIGHALSLTHAYIGADGSPRWVTHSHMANAMTPNANIVPYSVMMRDVPAAPYTLNGWASGLLPNLVGWDTATNGEGNAEAFKLSNSFRAVNDGFVTYAKNSFGPPLQATNNEL